MDIFETKITVKESDLDELNHVNNIRYVEWVQEIAKQHWFKKATSNILNTCFWVMTNHCIEYKNSALLNDTLNIKTYIKSNEGAISTRIVEISNGQSNVLIAKSQTKWCLISIKTKRPVRITEEITQLFE
jgi:acyl-CoA thioester hydrolase